MKKYLYSIVLATLILISTTVVKASNEVYYTNLKNVEMTESEYNNLINLGFSELQINMMSEQEFLSIKDYQGVILDSQEKYIKDYAITRNGITTHHKEEITEEEALAEKELQSQKPQLRGPSGNYYDGLTVTGIYKVKAKIIGVSDDYMILKTDVEWTTMPSYKYNDIIAAGFESAYVYRASGIVFKELWRETNGTYGEMTTHTPKGDANGGSAIFALPSGSLTQLEATVYFMIGKNVGITTLSEVHSCGDYAHATSNISASNLSSHYYVTVLGGITIDSTYANDFLQGLPADASFVGTW